LNYYNNTLISSNIASNEIIEKNSMIEDIIFFENINIFNNNDVINIKWNITDLIIENFNVIIQECKIKNNIEIKLNIDLFINSLCQFIRLKKINNNFIYTNLSDVHSNNDTFHDYFDINKYYNRIKINDNFFYNKQKVLC